MAGPSGLKLGGLVEGMFPKVLTKEFFRSVKGAHTGNFYGIRDKMSTNQHFIILPIVIRTRPSNCYSNSCSEQCSNRHLLDSFLEIYEG